MGEAWFLIFVHRVDKPAGFFSPGPLNRNFGGITRGGARWHEGTYFGYLLGGGGGGGNVSTGIRCQPLRTPSYRG